MEFITRCTQAFVYTTYNTRLYVVDIMDEVYLVLVTDIGNEILETENEEVVNFRSFGTGT